MGVFSDQEKLEYGFVIEVLKSSLLNQCINFSTTVIRELGDSLFRSLSNDLTIENTRYILFVIASFVYESISNGMLLDDALTKVLSKAFMASPDKSEVENTRALVYPTRLNTLILKDKTSSFVDQLEGQKKEIENFTNIAAAKAKENVDTLNNTDANLEAYLKKAKDLSGELGFLVLSKAFSDFITTKTTEVGILQKNLKRMGGVLLVIPLIVFSSYLLKPFFPLFINLVAGSAVVAQVENSTEKSKDTMAKPGRKTAPNVTFKPVDTEEPNVKSTSTSSVDWTQIINRLLNFMPLAVAELILLFYFRIILSNYSAANAQLLQLKMRQSACQFIQDYITFKKDSNAGDLDKFDSLIFSNLMPSAEQIPSTFEGLEQLGKILGEFKPKGARGTE